MGVGRIEFRVNGVTAGVLARPPGEDGRAIKDGREYTVTQQLALDPGPNTIEAVAYNASNLLASVAARTTIAFTGSADTAKPKLHVLAIGIDGYTDPGFEGRKFAPLALAVKDARALGAAFAEAGKTMYAETRIAYALDADATPAAIEATIDRMAKDIHPRDTFVLFAAAHGASANGRFYLIPHDFKSGPNALSERAIGQDRLQDWVANRIKAKRAVILLDTCESGALVGGHAQSRTDQPASEAAVGRLHEATGRPVLTAAATGKAALEGYKGHGVFTYALLDALKNADANNNGTIELSELAAHVQALVPKLSTELKGTGRAALGVGGATQSGLAPGGSQQSARFGSKGEDFAVARRLQ